MRKVRREEREATARLLNHTDDGDGDDEDMGEGGSLMHEQTYELKPRPRIRNGTATINPLVSLLQQGEFLFSSFVIDSQLCFCLTEVDVNHPKAKRRVYTDNSLLFDFVEWKIKPGDTLSSLSLKSGCTIAHLKRANNLISDQDFYALSVIRIPVKRYGILSQTLVLDHQETQPASSQETADLLGLSDAQVSSAPEANIRDNDDMSDAEKFIQQVDKEVTHIREKVTDNRTSPATSLTLTTSNEIPVSIPSPAPASSASFNCDGADGGLTMFHVLILVLIICILVPVIYIFLAEEDLEERRNHSLSTH